MEVPSIFLNRVLAEAAKRNASDFNLNVGSLPLYRIDGRLITLEEELITYELLVRIIESFLSPDELEKLKQDKELTIIKKFSNNLRFRINIFYQKDMPSLSLHYIPAGIKTLMELNLPLAWINFTEANAGLIIVAGAYGAGRTTTIASFIEEVNKNFVKNITTIEEQIESMFVSKKSIITQRQVGRDVKSFLEAVNHCLTTDEDIVYVSEIKDEKMFTAALPAIFELAAGNCLVIMEMYADSSIKVIDKILSGINKSLSTEASRHNLADILQAILIQKLLPHRGGGLSLACELLLNNPAVKSLIREGKIYQLETVLQTSRKEGMISIDKSVENLVELGEVRREDVY